MKLASPLTSSDGAHRPEGLGWTERVEGARMEIVLTPARLSMLPMFLFTLFWDGFLVVWYAIALAPGQPRAAMIFFPLLHVGVGVFLTYNVLVRLLNRSRFALDAGSIVLESRPIPQRGARESTYAVERFDVAPSASSFKMRGTQVWCVRMLMRDGRAVALALPISAETEVSFVAARLNAALAAVREPTGYRG
jgi:hypothetical protein